MPGPELYRRKIQIRNETDNVLNNTQLSSYAPMKKDLINDVLSAVGATSAVNSQAPDPYLTGALQAPVPLIISIPGKYNISRLEFTLLINPASWNQGKTTSTQNSFTRDGYVTQMWGPAQDLITSNGKTAAFMVEGVGLTSTARRRSFAYLNFLAFIAAYRNNGYSFIDPTKLSSTLTRVIGKVHGVELFYDGQYFMGHFNNFTIDEDAATPFLMVYNFEFVVSTLSNTYNEVRGHFEPIPPRIGNTSQDSPLVNKQTTGGD